MGGPGDLPVLANRPALRNWAVVPDSPANAGTEDELRQSLFDSLCENRVWVATRSVPKDMVRD